MKIEPNIFCHYLPSDAEDEVVNHFRVTRPFGSPGENLKTYQPNGGPHIYVAGDCTVFEDHLPAHETMSAQLQSRVQEKVLNAGVPHYTSVHIASRLMHDVLLGYRPSTIVYCAASANDTLSFINHSNGSVGALYDHFYVPWVPDYPARNTPLLKLIKIRIKKALRRDRGEPWDHFLINRNLRFYESKSVECAMALFTTETFLSTLEMMYSLSKSINSKLVLVTFACNPADMITFPRNKYQECIGILNDLVRQFAASKDIDLVDLAQGPVQSMLSSNITNKWNYNQVSNELRSQLIADKLRGASSNDTVSRPKSSVVLR